MHHNPRETTVIIRTAILLASSLALGIAAPTLFAQQGQ